MENRTNTLIDLFPDLLKSWRQDTCNHMHLDFTRKMTNNGMDFWAEGECHDCGKKIGGRISWSER